MLNQLNLLALLAFAVLIVVAVWLRRKIKSRSQEWSRMSGIVVTVLSLATWALTFQWHLDSQTRVVGFPFTAAVFELHDGRWVDYVGAITLPAMAANLVFWVLLFRLPLMWLRFIRSRPQQSAGANAPLGAFRTLP